MERLEQQTGEQENRKTPERRNSSSDDGHADMLRTLVTNRSKHPEVVPHYPSDYNLTEEPTSWLSKVIEGEPQTRTKRTRNARAQTDTDSEDQDLDSDRERQRKRIKTKDDRVEAQDEFKKLHEKILDLEKNIREKFIDASSVNLEEYEQNMKEFKELGSRLKEYGSLTKQRLETVITTAEEEVPSIERAIQNKANTITSTKKTIADSSEQIDSSIQTDSEDPTLLLKTRRDLLEGDKRQLEEDLAFAQSKITENLSLLGYNKTDYNIEELKKLHSGSEMYITQLDKILSYRTKYYEDIRKHVKNGQQTELHSHQEASSSASQSKHTHHPTDQQPRQDTESEASFSEDTSQEASESDTQIEIRRGYRRMQSPERGTKHDIPATTEEREVSGQPQLTRREEQALARTRRVQAREERKKQEEQALEEAATLGQRLAPRDPAAAPAPADHTATLGGPRQSGPQGFSEQQPQLSEQQEQPLGQSGPQRLPSPLRQQLEKGVPTARDWKNYWEQQHHQQVPLEHMDQERDERDERMQLALARQMQARKEQQEREEQQRLALEKAVTLGGQRLAPRQQEQERMPLYPPPTKRELGQQRRWEKKREEKARQAQEQARQAQEGTGAGGSGEAVTVVKSPTAQ